MFNRKGFSLCPVELDFEVSGIDCIASIVPRPIVDKYDVQLCLKPLKAALTFLRERNLG